MHFLVSLVVLSTIGGQIFRIPYLQGTGILASDILIAILLLAYTLGLTLKKNSLSNLPLNRVFFLFFIFSFISLLFNLYLLPTHDLLISFFYFIRFWSYCFLFLIGQESSHKLSYFFNLTLITSLIICILGFLQLKFFPNFEILRMQEKGWDPHIGRMLSTWFDPNFLGGFFAFCANLILGVIVLKFKKTEKIFTLIKEHQFILASFTLLLIIFSILLTYSRSSYLALLIGVFLIGLIASRKMLLIAFISVFIAFSFSGRLQSRITDAYASAKALFNPYSVDTLDATARYRIDSWQKGFGLFLEKPILGHGYNTIRYIQAKRGYTEWKSHNAGGFDASLLTVLVTTGSIGFLIFSFFLFLLTKKIFLNYKKENNLFVKGLNLGFLGGISGLLVHSFFVNSLLFPLIMIFVWFWSGLLIKAKG